MLVFVKQWNKIIDMYVPLNLQVPTIVTDDVEL